MEVMGGVEEGVLEGKEGKRDGVMGWEVEVKVVVVVVVVVEGMVGRWMEENGVPAVTIWLRRLRRPLGVRLGRICCGCRVWHRAWARWTR